MKRLIVALLCCLVVLAGFTVSPSFAQNAHSSPGLGKYWLVDDNAWDGVWIRQGDSSSFNARWSLEGEDDISAALTISRDSDSVTIDRVDPPTKWLVKSCHYTGTFAPDGVTVSGTTECIFTSGARNILDWSATVIYDPPDITWNANAVRYRAAKNSQFDFICPPNGAFNSLWGTDLYTDDSSICTAAVHARVITTAGGPVNLQILDGLDSYKSSLSNGVTSNSYGKWRASYRFSAASSIIPQITWADNAVQYRGQNGTQYTFDCLAQGSPRQVWGTDIYTDDSPICAAAVHAGVITTAGGVITIEIVAGQSSYQASERNGTSSSSYGSWLGSYRFV